MRKNYRRKFSFTLFIFLFIFCNFSVFSQRLFDSFEYKNAEESIVTIDYFLVELQKNPTNNGYINVYGGRNIKRGELKAHLKQLPQYITNFRGFDGKRMTYVHGGYREKLSLEFWIIPQGASFKPLPDPTIDFKDVKAKGKFKNYSLYMCCE